MSLVKNKSTESEFNTYVPQHPSLTIVENQGEKKSSNKREPRREPQREFNQGEEKKSREVSFEHSEDYFPIKGEPFDTKSRKRNKFLGLLGYIPGAQEMVGNKFAYEKSTRFPIDDDWTSQQVKANDDWTSQRNKQTIYYDKIKYCDNDLDCDGDQAWNYEKDAKLLSLSSYSEQEKYFNKTNKKGNTEGNKTHRHVGQPYVDMFNFAHTRPEHDFAQFVTYQTYNGNCANDWNGCGPERKSLGPREPKTTMLDGRTLEYKPQFSLPSLAVYFAEPISPKGVSSMRTIVFGHRGSRMNLTDKIAQWDWFSTDFLFLANNKLEASPRFKHDLQAVLRILCDESRFDQVIFTGHSLGGSIALAMMQYFKPYVPECSGAIAFNPGLALENPDDLSDYNTHIYRIEGDVVSGGDCLLY